MFFPLTSKCNFPWIDLCYYLFLFTLEPFENRLLLFYNYHSDDGKKFLLLYNYHSGDGKQWLDPSWTFSSHTSPLIFLHTSNSPMLLWPWVSSSDLSLFDLYFSWEVPKVGTICLMWPNKFCETITSLVLQLLVQSLTLFVIAAKAHC